MLADAPAISNLRSRGSNCTAGSALLRSHQGTEAKFVGPRDWLYVVRRT